MKSSGSRLGKYIHSQCVRMGRSAGLWARQSAGLGSCPREATIHRPALAEARPGRAHSAQRLLLTALLLGTPMAQASIILQTDTYQITSSLNNETTPTLGADTHGPFGGV